VGRQPTTLSNVVVGRGRTVSRGTVQFYKNRKVRKLHAFALPSHKQQAWPTATTMTDHDPAWTTYCIVVLYYVKVYLPTHQHKTLAPGSSSGFLGSWSGRHSRSGRCERYLFCQVPHTIKSWLTSHVLSLLADDVATPIEIESNNNVVFVSMTNIEPTYELAKEFIALVTDFMLSCSACNQSN